MTDTKTCTRCFETKPLKAFSKRKGGRCRACLAEYCKFWEQDRRDQQRLERVRQAAQAINWPAPLVSMQ